MPSRLPRLLPLRLAVAFCARRARVAAVLAAVLGPWGAAPAQAAGDVVSVSVERRDDWVIVDAGFTVDAPAHVTWSVLTDFEHMAQFVRSLQSSQVLARSGNRLRVRQTGRAERAGIGFSYDSLREITLTPDTQILSHAVGGSMRQMEATMRLEAQAARTIVRYHAESIPGVWVPPLIGQTLIAGQVREQFEDMRTEILRRHAAPLAHAALPTGASIDGAAGRP